MSRKKSPASVLNHEVNGNGELVVTPSAEGGWDDDPRRAAKNAAHLEAMESKPPKGKGKIVEIAKIDIRHLYLKLIGDSSLIVHKWSQKAIKQMLDKQMGLATEGREPKNPEQDFRDSIYHHPDGGYGFPSIAFKNCAVTACTSLGKAITKVAARQAFHIVGELAKIDGSEPTPREDMVRLDSGTADIRYRAEFLNWHTTLTVRYNHRVLTDAQIINLFNISGFGVGVGEWRSEKNGSHGLFHVATEGEG